MNSLNDELINVTRCCTEQGVPITHTIEPANLTDDCIEWLLQEKAKSPRLVELMQHGYDHKKRDRGEFGGNRPYDEQFRDLKRGKEMLQEKLGEGFLAAINYPFGPYNQHTIRATNELGYRILASHYNARLSRRLMYMVGHALRMGQIRSKHVSYHLDYYPRTNLFCIDMATTFIKTYIGDYGSKDCVFHSEADLRERILSFVPHTPVIGILLHHRFHHTPDSLEIIKRLIEFLRTVPDARFVNLEEIYLEFSPDKSLAFRSA